MRITCGESGEETGIVTALNKAYPQYQGFTQSYTQLGLAAGEVHSRSIKLYTYTQY